MHSRWFKSDTGDAESKASDLRKALVESGFRIENPQLLQDKAGTQKNTIQAPLLFICLFLFVYFR